MTARFTRRGFLLGGVGVLALAACTTDEPEPSATPTPTTEPEPSPSNDLLPAPAAFERSTWSTNEAFLGATSFLAVGGTTEARATLGSSVGRRLFFAGEHTAVEHPGMVTGAWRSGLRAAQEVLGVAEEGDRVLVVGAGIAGATAAAEIAAEGYEVIVLEARDRSGGRIGSVADDRWPFPVERGAAFLDTEADAELLAVLLEQGIETTPLFGREVRDADGRPGEEPVPGSGVVESALALAADAPEDVSLLSALGAVIAGQPGVDSASLGAYLRTVIEPRTGAASTAVSAKNGVQERIDPLELIGDGEDVGRPVAVTGGLENLVRSLLDGLDVRLGSGVAEVDVRDDAVGVRLSTGESLSGHRVVVAVPLGVLKAGGVTFDPPLPQAHLDALDLVGVGSRESVLLRWEAPFWDTDATLWTVTGTDSRFACWINLEPSTGEPVLIGVAAADSAEYLARLGDQQVLDLAAAALVPFRAAPGASTAPTETAEPTEP